MKEFKEILEMLKLPPKQPAIIFPITENTAVAQDNAVFNGLLMSELDTAAELSQFVLSDA